MARFIAFYLPQYHPIPENDKWWCKGFTEWDNVTKARPLFRGHNQPHIPADLGYYDLRMPEIRQKQAELAKNAGIEGFCYWHYWFGNGIRLLERPFEEVLRSGNPDFPFCLAWANHSWERKTWDRKGNSEMLIEQLYPGKHDYINHFNTMLPAFKDPRYIKINGKLLFMIFDPLGSPEISNFISEWRNLAQQNGLNDFYFIAKDADCRFRDRCLALGFDATYNDDVFNIHHHLNIVIKVLMWVNRNWVNRPTVFQYRKAIKYMVTNDCKERNVIPVIAPNWDHSPRSGSKAIILKDAAPKYFEKLIKIAINIVKNKPEENRIIIIKSWNEWGEGNYMEPDLEFGKGNLEVLMKTNNLNY
jgi:hypothetical protein